MKRYAGETELYELERMCSNITKVELEPVLRLIKEVRERREHEDKYRWHNLIKGESAPEFFKDVIVAIDCGDGEYDYESSYYGVTSPFNSEPCRMWAKNNVVAWKEIEPFEEEMV